MCFVVFLRTRHSENWNVIKSGNQILPTQWLVLLLVEGCSCPFVRWLLQKQQYSLCVWSLKLQLCCLFSQPMTWQRFCLNVMSFFVFLSVHVSIFWWMLARKLLRPEGVKAGPHPGKRLCWSLGTTRQPDTQLQRSGPSRNTDCSDGMTGRSREVTCEFLAFAKQLRLFHRQALVWLLWSSLTASRVPK